MTAQIKTNLFLVEAMTFVTQLKLIIKTSRNGVKNWKHIPISHVVTFIRRFRRFVRIGTAIVLLALWLTATYNVKAILESTFHCHCLPKVEQGRLNNKSCRLNASGQSDIVGTNVPTGYKGELYQIAIYRLTNDILNINADTLDACLLNSTTHISTHPCDGTDSSKRTWTNAIINGLPSNDGNQLQWTRFIRRRIIRWTQGHVLDLNTSACVSVRKLSNEQEYEILLRPCNDKLPYICLEGNDKNTHKMMTSSLKTSPSLPSKPPENTISSIGGMPVYSKTSHFSVSSSFSFFLSICEEFK
ncbi:uncharacterized protein LOC128164781 [Crassostrea angulata]|uniref:uncharacterized protein LOC128164781 n=1 Tax=Magallana angulata TaxID=2784310 RepID=UPI0022B1D2B4|nr:uncharacterized protein LOC128164781 [Crassostrea angulata]